ncbi:MAG: thiamine-phosphate kinase [Pseudomonadota bacterium]
MSERAADGLDEFEIIAKHFVPLAKSGATVETFSLQDDAATITSRPGKRLVVTADSIVAGVHFFGDEPAGEIAQKALRTNLSDLAGKAARPIGYTLSLHLPASIDDAWLTAFAAGLAADQTQFDITLLGGDTTRANQLIVAITAIGEIDAIYHARRDALPNDDIWVSGTIGDAALGLKLYDGTLAMEGQGAEHLQRRYRLPEPRFELAEILNAYANASMDVSDGLLTDLGKLCKASKLQAQILAADIPVSDAARQAIGQLDQALELSSGLHPVMFGGDDYEILFTADPKAQRHIAEKAQGLPFRLTRIGHVSDLEGLGEVLLIDGAGNSVQLAGTGHTHRI